MPRREEQEELVPIAETRQCCWLAVLVERAEGGNKRRAEYGLRLQHADFHLGVV